MFSALRAKANSKFSKEHLSILFRSGMARSCGHCFVVFLFCLCTLSCFNVYFDICGAPLRGGISFPFCFLSSSLSLPALFSFLIVPFISQKAWHFLGGGGGPPLGDSINLPFALGVVCFEQPVLQSRS